MSDEAKSLYQSDSILILTQSCGTHANSAFPSPWCLVCLIELDFVPTASILPIALKHLQFGTTYTFEDDIVRRMFDGVTARTAEDLVYRSAVSANAPVSGIAWTVASNMVSLAGRKRLSSVLRNVRLCHRILVHFSLVAQLQEALLTFEIFYVSDHTFQDANYVVVFGSHSVVEYFRPQGRFRIATYDYTFIGVMYAIFKVKDGATQTLNDIVNAMLQHVHPRAVTNDNETGVCNAFENQQSGV
jgi:hypothetical protein